MPIKPEYCCLNNIMENEVKSNNKCYREKKNYFLLSLIHKSILVKTSYGAICLVYTATILMKWFCSKSILCVGKMITFNWHAHTHTQHNLNHNEYNYRVVNFRESSFYCTHFTRNVVIMPVYPMLYIYLCNTMNCFEMVWFHSILSESL